MSRCDTSARAAQCVQAASQVSAAVSMHLQNVVVQAVAHLMLSCGAFVSRAQEEQLSVSGRNWGDAVVDKSSLVFRVDKKTAFNIAIPDVSQVW